MPGESWPKNAFYIVSKLRLQNYALQVSDKKLILAPLSYGLNQLWQAVPIGSSSDGVQLKHVESGLSLCGPEQRHPVTLAIFDLHSPAFIWRREKVDDWFAINVLHNWEAKLNIYASKTEGPIGLWNWSKAAENELWCMIEETGSLTILDLQFNKSQAVAGKLPPHSCLPTIVDNSDPKVHGPVKGKRSLERELYSSRSTSQSESSTTGRVYRQSLGMELEIKKILKLTAEASFEESESKTVGWDKQQVDSERVVDTVEVDVNVPPGKKYKYQVVVYYGKITVPYTAKLKYQSQRNPGVGDRDFTVTGEFQGVNATVMRSRLLTSRRRKSKRDLWRCQSSIDHPSLSLR